MKWNKLGLVFNPKAHPLAEDFFGYAQSPQTLEFPDCVRVYFSTRKQEANKQFISVIQYADFDKRFSQVLRTSTHTVLPPAKLGTFDEHGIFPINICAHDQRILGYTTGWTRRSSVSVDTGIGVVESKDQGHTFERLDDGPVLTASLHEPFLVCDAFVRHFNKQFHMFYIYGTRWKVYQTGEQPERTYVIGHAVSHNGIDWKKSNRALIEQTDPDECQALPTVIEIQGRYHMLFCYRKAYNFRSNAHNGYRIGYAYSDDLITWHRDDSKAGLMPTPGQWDSDMMCYPHLCRLNESIFVLYNGNEFGRHGFGVAQLIQVD